MDSSIIYKLADIEAVLSHLNDKVSFLETSKHTINLLQQKYPDLKYNHKYYTSANVKDEITGMKIERKHKSTLYKGGTYFITAKFYVNPSLNYGIKVYLDPLEHIIAEHNYFTHPVTSYIGKNCSNVQSDTITIFNFNDFVDNNWHRSSQFIKRIRYYILKYIDAENATISDISYDRGYFEGLMALK